MHMKASHLSADEMAEGAAPALVHPGRAGRARPGLSLGAPSLSASLPGSLAAALSSGAHPTTLLFPGIDAEWPRALAGAVVGRQWLAEWVAAVAADLDAWARTPEIRAFALFPNGFADLLRQSPEEPVALDAATGPAILAGNLLTNLASLAALDAEGLLTATTATTTRAAGHSAGLLAAWVAAAARGEDGLVPVGAAAGAARIAALMGLHAQRHDWSVSDTAVAAARAGDERAATPMVAISGPRTARLRAVLHELAGTEGRVVLAVRNSPTRHVLSGDPRALATLRDRLDALARSDADRRSRGLLGGAPFQFAWDPLPSTVPFHHPALSGAAAEALAHIEELGLALPKAGAVPVIDPATGRSIPGPDALATIVESVLARDHDWGAAVPAAVPAGGVAVMASALGSLAGVCRSILRGRGALVLDPAVPAERSQLFTPGGAPTIPRTYERFAPRVVRGADGRLRLDNRHTRLSGRSPIILPGMTPSTAEAPIVAAAANGGHVAELAGGGQVSERIFTERIAELGELLDPGHEVVLNALLLDPYLWDLQLGRGRLVQRARAAGAPIGGVTISAGIPERAEALALLDELVAAGIWLNAFKPGTVAQVKDALAVAAETPHDVWLHLEGGAAGGHHSWEDLDELLLATYHLVRQHDNVVLAVGGGIADPGRAAALLTGTWAHAHGAPAMPVDAVLLGTVTMATRESAASPAVKAALVQAAGHPGWVGRGEVRGGTTSGRSGLDADIHFLDNSASRAARLLDEVAGDAGAVAARRDEIIAALAATAKPHFGDLEDMTYAQMLGRFADLTALGRHGRYEDGAWLDPTHRGRFIALLQQAEARLHPADSGRIATMFADPSAVDDPRVALEQLCAAHPTARTALLHPADVAHFLAVARRPGKPVPFVPVIDADVRRWYQSDSLWQSHSDRYDADQVLIIPGPTAVAGITSADEPVAQLLDRFESAVAESIAGQGASRELPVDLAGFRLGRTDAASGSSAGDLIMAALRAPTWRWMGANRPNPLRRIGPVEQWSIHGDSAAWSDGAAESATLSVGADGALELAITWPGLGQSGDDGLVLPVAVDIRAGVISFAVEEAGLGAAGRTLLELLAAGAGGPGDPRTLAASHAATVGAGGALPDRVMARLWPQVFAAMSEAGLAPAILDLVHLRHELAVGNAGLVDDGDVGGAARAGGAAAVGGAAPTRGAVVERADGGLIVTVASAADDVRVTDRFFVRRAVVDPHLPEARHLESPAEAIGTLTRESGDSPAVPTPVRTLGTLSLAAPTRLEAFATVSGDANPIHRSDVLARFVGLPGRIVHGMWTSAAATRAVVEHAADGDPDRVRAWAIEFLAPLLPGEVVKLTVTRTAVRAGTRVISVEAATGDRIVATATASVAPPRTMYVFPGQGIQAKGMGMDAYARSGAARSIWDRADAITRERLGFSILEVVRVNPTSIRARGVTYRHPAGVLNLTQFTQVAMAALASAQVAQLREQGVFDPDAPVAGHSVGEYNALAASADVLPLEAVIELVFARGLAMHGLVPRDAEGRSDYRLAVVRPHLVGLTHAEVEHQVAAVAEDTGQLCEIVNHNLRGKQYAVSGTVAALAELGRRLGEGTPGRPPILTVPGLDVPFHSSALLGGVDGFRAQLRATLPARIRADALVGRYVPNLYPHAFSVGREYVEGVHGVCGSPVLAGLLADWEAASADRDGLARTLLIELLAWQFASPVRWIEAFELMCTPVGRGGLGVERIIEVGLGSAPTLANLAKGSLALPSHRGTHPRVLNVEVDADEVFDTTQDLPGDDGRAAVGEADDAAPAPDAGAPSSTDPVRDAEDEALAIGSSPVADLPVGHATALGSLLALRVGVRPDQLDGDSIETLVDGASSRRNQVLMDIGREFAVPAIDGAHELSLADLTARLAERAPTYRYPGPVLSAAVDGALTATLGPLGSSAAALAKRVASHWGLAQGWTDRAGLALALGSRDGSSRRGGDLADITGAPAEDLIDSAVLAVAATAGVAVSPAAASHGPGAAVDAAAVIELREHVEGMLAGQAGDILARLGRLPASDQDEVDRKDADGREALARLALLESEHGSAHLVAPAFDPRRHVLLASATAWARADVDHLVQASLAAEASREHAGGPEAGRGTLGTVDIEALVDQISVHREADPRIALTLAYHRDRAAAAGRHATVALIDRVQATAPRGVPVPDLAGLRAALGDRGALREVLAAAEQLEAAPGAFADQVALVTGASPGSIAWTAVAHLLRGGATVVIATTADTPQRISAYRDLERSCAGVGAQLHVVRANLASFADIDALVEWLVTPTVESVGPASREVKPALWPTLVLPFAAAPAGGALPDTGQDAQATMRLLLLGVQRLVGRLAERGSGAADPAASGRDPFTVILPLSPNHGTFGGDGAYGEAKAALETMANRWHSEAATWGRRTRLILAEIGWVRGTGLMSGNDRIATRIEQELGVVTFAAEQMGALIAALATAGLRELASVEPLRVDLTGGLGGGRLIGAALARAVAGSARASAEPAPGTSAPGTSALAASRLGTPAAPAATIAALPNLPEVLANARSPIEAPAAQPAAQVRAEDMIVMVGIAEYGPWGGTATRWQAELGEVESAGVVELAWRCGLITWDGARGSWADSGTREPVDEAHIAQRYRGEVARRCGVRQLERTPGVAAEGYWEFAELYLDRAMSKVVPTRAEAQELAASTPGAAVTRVEEGWTLTLPAGAAVRVPRRRPLSRSVGGQFPSGSDPVRHGLDASVAGSMDPLAAWNVVITAEALADAGVTPEELVAAVHPSLVGNTQGTGMGGMSSINGLYMGPATGRHPANDILQEALGNVVSAHVNQGLVGGYGPMVHPVAACATAAVSLEEAVDKIALGKAEVVIGGGWDDLATEGINGFAAMAATADNEALIAAGLAPHQHSRPGDRRRRGFVEAQGGGSFVICRGSVALALGLPVRAVVGYAASFGDGIHTSIPAPGLGALGAARGGSDSPLGRALARLGLAVDDIAVVSKHDTSTEANDPNEAFIHDRIQTALGRTPGAPLRVISQKSLTGHAKGGAAAWQLAGLCDVFATGWVPGNANLVSVDPGVVPGNALVVDHRPLRRHEPVRAALATSLGFGHVSAVVALAHPDVFVAAIPPDLQHAYLRAARSRRVAGSMRRLRAMHGGTPVLVRRTDRRLGAGSPAQTREREAGMLLAVDGAMPGARES